MINLISTLPATSELAAVRGAHIHLYDKASWPGRKLGHVNVTGDDEAEVVAAAEQVWNLASGARWIGGPSPGRFPLHSLHG